MIFDQLSLPGTIKEYGILYAHAGFPKGRFLICIIFLTFSFF